MKNAEIGKETIDEEVLFAESFERVRPALEALTAEELIPINLEVGSTLATTMGVLPEIQALRPQMVKQLPDFEIEQFDKLEDYARALARANVQFLRAGQPKDDLVEIVEEATKARELLLADATTLAAHGIIDTMELKALKGPIGYKNLAQDLQVLADTLKDNWTRIGGRCVTTLDQLTRAQKTSARISRLVGLREQNPVVLAAATEMRLRAFTVFLRVYEEVRAAVTYLRRKEGDVDSIAPSLYAGRRKPKGDETADPNATLPAGTAVPVPVVAAPAGAFPAVPTNGQSPVVTKAESSNPYLPVK